MKIVLFTNSYPFGIGEMWKHNEIQILADEFDQIEIVPLLYGGNKIPKRMHCKNVVFSEPIIHGSSKPLTYIDVIKTFVGPGALTNLIELFLLIKNIDKDKVIRLLNSAKRVRQIIRHESIKKVLNSEQKDTILYFYWGVGIADILPLININQFKKIVVRLHRFDVYEYENKGYIPYRQQLMNKRITFLPCSDDGTNYLINRYPKRIATVNTQRLGVLPHKKTSFGSNKSILNIVSCSSLTEVKRIDLMIQAAEKLTIPFQWIHIGNGELFESLELAVRTKGLKDKFKFIGSINSELIIEYLIQGSFDLFINTSRSEGVPVSIMEALSVGLPVIATDAGGTKEIVDDSVGQLLKIDFQISELKEAIEKFNSLENKDRENLKQNALLRFIERCDIEKLTKEFIEFLKK
jgi:colanic acid/amylovoran biosynthesis glycosyltransferase